MISVGSIAQGRSSPSSAVEWSSLPDELLAIVCSKIFSPRGRVRFAAVCSSWRAAASQHPATPALPLLLLSASNRGTEKRRLYCPEDDDILSVPLPSALHEQRTWLSGSYDGGWIVAGGMNKIAIVNLFSGFEVPLSKKQINVKCTRHRGPYFVWKIIFSEAPTSDGCVLAGITDVCNIALCRVGCPDGGWTMEGCEREELGDIAFCKGQLYGLTKCSEKLFRYNIGENEDGAPVVTAACLLNVKRRDGPVCKSKYFSDYVSYIFEFCGKLAMAVRIPWYRNGKNFFKVFELDPANANNDAHD
jgi:hypothetical protein